MRKAATRQSRNTRAGYDRYSQVVVDHGPRDLARHYVMHRAGAVARVWFPRTLLVEVALWRPANLHPAYQGKITHDGTRYVATDPTGAVVATAKDYLEAEAVLLRLRTGRRSNARHEWPTAHRAELRRRVTPAPKPTCDVCGHPLRDGYTVSETGGTCTRPDLHWTTESLAAQDARRAARRAARAAA